MTVSKHTLDPKRDRLYLSNHTCNFCNEHKKVKRVWPRPQVRKDKVPANYITKDSLSSAPIRKASQEIKLVQIFILFRFFNHWKISNISLTYSKATLSLDCHSQK